jgi:nucleolar GTP-binding protein
MQIPTITSFINVSNILQDMSFNDIPKIESVQWYLDLAFRNANKKAKDIKAQKGPKEDTIKKAEIAKINEVRRTLTRHLTLILTSFPSIDGMAEFYQELVRTTLDYRELKQSLGALNWASKKLDEFAAAYTSKVRKCREFRVMISYPKEFYGRASSVMKQVKKSLLFLDKARQAFRDFPSIKQGIFTVAIAGFPNVGKTTLLTKLTSAKPEIAAYAFTTKKLNTGYSTIDNHKVQFIDTPGTLNRFEKMNPIERQAYLAIKYCADLIIFVFDTSDQTYEAETQLKLLTTLKRHRKPIIVYLSKTDIGGEAPPSLNDAVSDQAVLKAALLQKIGK